MYNISNIIYIYIYSLFNFDVFDINIFECHPDLMDTLQFVYDPAEDRLQGEGRTARPCIWAFVSSDMLDEALSCDDATAEQDERIKILIRILSDVNVNKWHDLCQSLRALTCVCNNLLMRSNRDSTEEWLLDPWQMCNSEALQSVDNRRL